MWSQCATARGGDKILIFVYGLLLIRKAVKAYSILQSSGAIADPSGIWTLFPALETHRVNYFHNRCVSD